MTNRVEYIGQRLRQYRREKDWSGQEVARRLEASIGGSYDWPFIRDLEDGIATPTTEVAVALARAFDRTPFALLLPGGAQQTRPTSQWPSRRPSADDLHSVRQSLSKHGHSIHHAEQFFRMGASAGAARAWLSSFEPDEAFAWLRCRFSPSEAGQWKLAGIGVDDAVRLSALGLRAGDAVPPEVRVLGDQGVRFEAAMVWHHVGHDLGTAMAWLQAGWDLLAAIPWVSSGIDPANARAWFEGGFTVPTAIELTSTLSAEDAGRWGATNLDMGDWLRWQATGAGPAGSEQWAVRGFDPEDAAAWIEKGFDASEAETYRRAGCQSRDAASWKGEGIDAQTAALWLSEGLGIAQFKSWRSITANPTQVRRLIDSGVSVADAAAWSVGDVALDDVASWRDAGFSQEAAGAWAPASPARARRLLRRGVTPQTEAGRRDAGAARLEAARIAMRSIAYPSAIHAGRPAPDATSHGVDGSPSIPTCSACEQPIRPNDRCGCS